MNSEMEDGPLPGTRIVCRPKKSDKYPAYLAGLFLALYAALIIFASPHDLYDDGTSPGLLLAGLSFIFTTALAVTAWPRIIVDDEGVTWRDLKSARERSVTWNQVQDYYLALGGCHFPTLETDVGRVGLPCWYEHCGELMEFAASRAVASNNQGWWVEKTELEPGEARTFQYGRGSRLLYPGLMVFAGGLSLPLFYMMSGTSMAGAGFLGWSLIWPVIILAVTTMVVFAGTRSFGLSHDWLAKHQDDEIILTAEHVRWTNGEATIQVNWEQIREIRPAIRGCSTNFTIVTENGEFGLDFGFFSVDKGWEIKGIMSRYMSEVTKR